MNDGKKADRIDPLWVESLKEEAPRLVSHNATKCPECGQPSFLSCKHGEHPYTDCSMHDSLLELLIQMEWEKKIKRRIELKGQFENGKLVVKATSLYQSTGQNIDRVSWYWLEGSWLRSRMIATEEEKKKIIDEARRPGKESNSFIEGWTRRQMRMMEKVADVVPVFRRDLTPEEQAKSMTFSLNGGMS